MRCTSPPDVAESSRATLLRKPSEARARASAPERTSTAMVSRFRDCTRTVRARSPDIRLTLRMEARSSRAALSLKATWKRCAADATSPAMPPATDVNCAMSGSTAPANAPSLSPAASASWAYTSLLAGTD